MTQAARSRTLPPSARWAAGALIAGVYAALFWAETHRPLRRPTQPVLARNLRNAALATLSAGVLAVLEAPVVGPLTRAIERRRWGLLQQIRPPGWLELPLAVAAMDYSLYLWHVWTHKGPLWRFHQAHHVDLDMDASTALRFHFGELAASIPYRALQVLLIGVGPRAFATWRTFLMLCIGFHHSNLRLPPGVERRLGAVLVTPRNHGIHHTADRSATDSNWSSGLTVWDRLHGTLRLEAPQGGVAIGVPAYRDPAELGFVDVVAMPFRPQRDAWSDRP